MRRVTAGLIAALALTAAAAGCDKAITTPTTPTTQNPVITESFADSIGPGGARTFTFFTAASGFLTATLKSLSPDSTVEIGLSMGTFNGVACTVTQIFNDKTLVGQAVSGNVSGSGSLCVRLYDANGTLTRTNSCEIVVVHP